MTIQLTSETLESFQLTLFRKRQRNSSFSNIYITPNVGLVLYNPKVLIVNEGYLVFQFSKRDHLSLLLLLRKISETLSALVKATYCDLKDTFIYSVQSESETHFTLRVSLPGTKNKYFVGTDDALSPFRLPRANATYAKATIEFRNYWEKDKLGMNTELKSIVY